MIPSLKEARIVFAGGGTGGHLFPALAIADRIRELLSDDCKVQITFVGTKRGIEFRLRESLGYPLRLINVRGIARSLTLRNLALPFVLVGALLKSRSILSELAPHVVVGTGGYVSWPILKAASWKRIPTVLQEQNTFPGIATRRLAARSKSVYLGFEEAREHLADDVNTVTTGNPMRKSVLGGDRDEATRLFKLDPSKKTILVLGGSQGARSINNAIIRSLRTGQPGEKYQLLWQTGKRDYKDVVVSTGEEGKGHSLFPFENRMALVYAAADLAIARAGAISLAELEACGIPAILIPYPYAAGDHQRKNAEAYVKRGMAEMVVQAELGNSDILTHAVTLLESDKAEQMRDAIARQAASRKPAADIIAENIIELIARTQEAGVGA
ncbi:MAG: undecaprenyldiphospho-muramoylpentapeptide beta-N-acetylglucosaminyltransferase [Candidatus Zixiibacteriota bacterium]|nr:MAG: undecaprenyldiphospho-muramoylpentapeptide beta-N-acetylglucosaminyltransferase [candidate division Zixibacteria bacterium]